MVESNYNQNPNLTNLTPTTTRIIQEQPVLDRIEKLEHLQRVEDQNIHETHVQNLIEVHERPIEKVVQHSTKEVFVQDPSLFEEQGRDSAALERDRVLRDLEEQNRHHRITVEEHQDVNIVRKAPSTDLRSELTKEIVEKPIVTEIHHQPVVERHEQVINKTIYERPQVTVVRDAQIQEQCCSSTTLPMTHGATTTTSTTSSFPTEYSSSTTSSFGQQPLQQSFQQPLQQPLQQSFQQSSTMGFPSQQQQPTMMSSSSAPWTTTSFNTQTFQQPTTFVQQPTMMTQPMPATTAPLTQGVIIEKQASEPLPHIAAAKTSNLTGNRPMNQ